MFNQEDIITILEKEESINKVFSIIKFRDDINYKKYVDSLKITKEDVIISIEKMIDDYNKNISILFYNHNLLKTSLQDYNIEDKNKFDIYYLVYLKLLLVVFLSHGQISMEYYTMDKRIQIDSNNGCIEELYRGQSDFTYDLLPSLYRNLDYSGIITKDVIEEIYKHTHLYDKYIEVFDSYSINYDFLAFMQHATEYSPLIDFTKNKKIALMFATNPYNKNYNKYDKTDCSLYRLYLRHNIPQNNFSLKEHNIQFFKTKLRYNSIIFDKPIVLCELNDFKVKYQIFTKPTNDRMKYQQGAFLYFQKCVIANGILLFPFSQAVIEKYKISSKTNSEKHLLKYSKQELYNSIIKEYPQYSLEHLMNPYLFFTEFCD